MWSFEVCTSAMLRVLPIHFWYSFALIACPFTSQSIWTAFHTSFVAIGSYARHIYTMIAHSQFSMGHARVRNSILLLPQIWMSARTPCVRPPSVKLPECDLAFSFHTSRGIGPRERVFFNLFDTSHGINHESESSLNSRTPPIVSSRGSGFASKSFAPLIVSYLKSASSSSSWTPRVPSSAIMLESAFVRLACTWTIFTDGRLRLGRFLWHPHLHSVGHPQHLYI